MMDSTYANVFNHRYPGIYYVGKYICTKIRINSQLNSKIIVWKENVKCGDGLCIIPAHSVRLSNAYFIPLKIKYEKNYYYSLSPSLPTSNIFPISAEFANMESVCGYYFHSRAREKGILPSQKQIFTFHFLRYFKPTVFYRTKWVVTTAKFYCFFKIRIGFCPLLKYIF